MVQRMKSYQRDRIRLYERVLEELRDMAGGGDGGPYRMGYTWTTVRQAYFKEWTDAQFVAILTGLGEEPEPIADQADRKDDQTDE